MYQYEPTRLIPVKDRETGESSQILFHAVFTDRVSAMRRTLKRPGKGGRLYKYQDIYVGVLEYQEARRVLAAFMGRNMMQLLYEIRHPKRSLDWSMELKIKGDFDPNWIEWVASNVEAAIARQPFPDYQSIEANEQIAILMA